MTKKTLKLARLKAARFMIEVIDLETQIKEGKDYSNYIGTFTVKRASMDLTRALAEIRKS